MKQLRIVSGGTGMSTRFELVDEHGNAEPLEIPCESVEWSVAGGKRARVTITGWNAGILADIPIAAALAELDREIQSLTEARDMIAGKDLT